MVRAGAGEEIGGRFEDRYLLYHCSRMRKLNVPRGGPQAQKTLTYNKIQHSNG